jgi:hypothetical protein
MLPANRPTIKAVALCRKEVGDPWRIQQPRRTPVPKVLIRTFWWTNRRDDRATWLTSGPFWLVNYRSTDQWGLNGAVRCQEAPKRQQYSHNLETLRQHCADVKAWFFKLCKYLCFFLFHVWYLKRDDFLPMKASGIRGRLRGQDMSQNMEDFGSS